MFIISKMKILRVLLEEEQVSDSKPLLLVPECKIGSSGLVIWLFSCCLISQLFYTTISSIFEIQLNVLFLLQESLPQASISLSLAEPL